MGWCDVFDALRDNPNNKIKEWDLSNQGITPTITKSLAAYVAVSGSLTSLSLADNNLGDEGVEALSFGLKRSKSLKALDLSIFFFGFGSTKFGPKGAMALASAIAGNGSLTSLNLEGNQLGNEGWCAVIDALRDKPQIRLDNINQTIARDNSIGEEGKRALQEAVGASSEVPLQPEV